MKYNVEPLHTTDAAAAYSEEQQIMLGAFVYAKGKVIPLALVADNLRRHLGRAYSLNEVAQKLWELEPQVAIWARRLELYKHGCSLTKFEPSQPGPSGDLPRQLLRYVALPSAADVLARFDRRQQLMLASLAMTSNGRLRYAAIKDYLARHGYRDETESAIAQELVTLIKPKIDHTAPGRTLRCEDNHCIVQGFSFRRGDEATVGELLISGAAAGIIWQAEKPAPLKRKFPVVCKAG